MQQIKRCIRGCEIKTALSYENMKLYPLEINLARKLTDDNEVQELLEHMQPGSLGSVYKQCS